MSTYTHLTSSERDQIAALKASSLSIRAIAATLGRDGRPDDQLLFDDSLHWVKSRDFELDQSRPIPFLSFDSNCFYGQWGFSEGLQHGHSFEKVLECPSAAGIQSGLGIALLNGLHLTPEIEVIEGMFPAPPPNITFVARINPKSRSAPVKALVEEIALEFKKPMWLGAAE
jgi:hypothetical protein